MISWQCIFGAGTTLLLLSLVACMDDKKPESSPPVPLELQWHPVADATRYDIEVNVEEKGWLWIGQCDLVAGCDLLLLATDTDYIGLVPPADVCFRVVSTDSSGRSEIVAVPACGHVAVSDPLT